MVDFLGQGVETALQPQAWRIEFVDDSKALPGGVDRIEITEPLRLF